VRLFRYYASLGADAAILGYSNANLYGGLFDLAGECLERLLPLVPWYLTRHLLTLACGTAAVWFAARTAGELAGARAAWLAGAILALTPRWFGHALFNPKDVPFAAAWIAATYLLVRLARSLPSPPLRLWAAFGVAVGLAFAVRIGAVLLGGFAVIVIGVAAARGRLSSSSGGDGRRALRGLALAGLVAVALGVTFWPYLQHAGIGGFFRVLAGNADFEWRHGVYFAGEKVKFGEIGRRYLPAWMAIALPLATLLGALLAAAFLPRSPRRRAVPAEAWLALLLSALFAPVYVVVAATPLYDGVRHMLFVVPALSVVAALGWDELLERLRERAPLRRAAGAALALLALETAAWLVLAHPYEYVYFNPAARMLADAGNRFETEYWGLSGREIARALERLGDTLPAGETLVAGVNLPSELVRPFLAPDSRVVVNRTPRSGGRWVEAYHLRVGETREIWMRGEERAIATGRRLPGQPPAWFLVDRGRLAPGAGTLAR